MRALTMQAKQREMKQRETLAVRVKCVICTLARTTRAFVLQ